jgi:hypothetical protein
MHAGDVPRPSRRRARDHAWAARHVQHAVARADLRRIEQEPHRLLVRMRPHPRKPHRLMGELVHNKPVVIGADRFMVVTTSRWLLFFQSLPAAAAKLGEGRVGRPAGGTLPLLPRTQRTTATRREGGEHEDQRHRHDDDERLEFHPRWPR